MKVYPASEKQINFIRTLRAERNLRALAASEEQTLTGGRNGTASRMITELLAMPKPARDEQSRGERKDDAALPGEDEVPAGKYALDIAEAGKVVLRFFKIDRPQRGKWVGRVFIAQMEGDNHKPIRDHGFKALIMGLVKQDVEGAARRYGHHRNECAYCRHGLTDRYSRFFGVGPVCARKHGMPYSFAQYIQRGGSAARTEVNLWLLEDAKINPVDDDPIADRLAEKAEFAAREREQENAAYEAKMQRDLEALAGQGVDADLVRNEMERFIDPTFLPRNWAQPAQS